MKKKAAPKKKKKHLASSEEFRNKLKLKHLRAKEALTQAHPAAVSYLAERGIDPGNLRKHSSKIIGTSLVAGALLTQAPNLDKLPKPSDFISSAKVAIDESKNENVDRQQTLLQDLGALLPETTRPLYRNEEKYLEQVLTEATGIKVMASLEGEHLNTTYGRIGAEQHLKRYPGDTLSEHGSLEDQKEGIAPGLGAWGYFAPSKEALTEDLVETEKWYAVVQTLYLPDWNTRQPYLKNWYKYRKVMIVNTDNGNAVVASIADSGPAAWTGKHYGGSPEVMDHLGGPRYKKGPVLVFFVDDPENQVPLGPVDYTKVNVPLTRLE